MSQHKSGNPYNNNAMGKISTQSKKLRVSMINIHLNALKTASLIHDIWHTTVFSELIGESNILPQRII
jgi:hypothetical protein